MSLHEDLRRLFETHRPGPLPLSEIEQRARHLRNRSRARGGFVVGLLLVGSALGVANEWGRVTRSQPERGSRNEAGPATTPTPAATTSPSDRSAICERIDADSCGEREGLRHAERWLGDRLTAAGFTYLNGYRADGGGSHTNRRWNFSIWALRPTTATSEEVASRYEYRRLWSTHGATIFGTARKRSPLAYFYWRAGGVDTWAHVGWKASQATRPQDLQQAEDLRQVFARIIEEQERNPYPYDEQERNPYPHEE